MSDEDNSLYWTADEPTVSKSKKLSPSKQRHRKRLMEKLTRPPEPFSCKGMEMDRLEHRKGRRKIRDMLHVGEWAGTPHPEMTTEHCPQCDDRRTFINGVCATCRKKATA